MKTIICLLIFSVSIVQAQIQPITVTAAIASPASAYISDYFAIGTNALTLNILFNDLNEPSWDVYIKTRIESSQLQIRSSLNRKPSIPLTIHSATPMLLKGDDLASYIEPEHFESYGPAANEYIKNGRLPEGFYSFCFTIYDYASGKKLSNEFCINAHIRQLDAPLILSPTNASVIKAANAQQLFFSWQVQQSVPPTTTYTLHLYEINDDNENPMLALQNGKVNPIFESEPLKTNSFYYDASYPTLLQGKKYTFNIKASTEDDKEDDKEVFRNKGQSETKWFYYGYPEDGYIKLLWPPDSHAFSLREDKNFKWTCSNKLIDQQSISYQLGVYEMAANELAEDALLKKAIYTTNSAVTLQRQNWTEPLPLKLETGIKYAWKVKAYTEGTEVAQSDIYTFNGPPYLESFQAGNHTIIVTRTSKNDMNSMSGEGTIKIDNDDKEHIVIFKNICIERIGSELRMTKGRIANKWQYDDILLKAEFVANGNASFICDSLIINPKGIRIKGYAKWLFPMAIINTSKTEIRSEICELNYNSYTLEGSILLDNDHLFELIEPSGFKIKLSKTSKLFVRGENNFFLNLNGVLIAPDKIKSKENNTFSLPFLNKKQLFFIKEENIENSNLIKPLPDAGLYIQTLGYIFDASEKESSIRHSENEWKGLWISDYTLIMEKEIDVKNQLVIPFIISQTHKSNGTDSSDISIYNEGLDVLIQSNFLADDGILCNTFPAYMQNIQLKMKNSSISNSKLIVRMAIPLLSETERFSATIPIDNRGFCAGFLNDGVAGKTFYYNSEGGEQKIELTVNTAVFKSQKLLEMNVDVKWPFPNVEIKNANGLNIWGNYDIGFTTQNGAYAISNQVMGLVNDFPVTVHHLGCGRQGNMYALGIATDIIMGSDIAGDNGPPQANLYSMVENNLLSGFVTFSGVNIYTNINNTQNQSANEGDMFTNNDLSNPVSLNNRLQRRYAANLKPSEINSTITVNIEPEESSSTYDSSFLVQETTTIQKNSHIQFVEPSKISIEQIYFLTDILISLAKKEDREKLIRIRDFAALMDINEIENAWDYLMNTRERINKYLIDLTDKYTDKLIDKLSAPVDKAKLLIQNKTYAVRDSICIFIDKRIERVLDSTASLIRQSSGNDSSAIEKSLVRLTQASKVSLCNEVRRSLTKSIDDNILIPISTQIDRLTLVRLQSFVDSVVHANMEHLLNGEFKDLSAAGLVENPQSLLNDFTLAATNSFKTDNVLNAIKKFANDAFNNLQWQNIYTGIVNEMIGTSVQEYAEKYTKNLLVKGVTNLADSIGGAGAANIANQLARNVDIDFSNLGEKIKNGDIGKIIRFDPSYIKVRTKVADFEGYVKFTDDDPIWGDSWQASLMANLKVQPKFKVYAKYINGSKNKPVDFKYWFIEIAVSGLKVPLSPLPLLLDGAAGKVYSHMSHAIGGKEYLPDHETDYGLGLQVNFVDAATAGKSYYFDVGLELAFSGEDYQIELNGNIAVSNKMKGCTIVKSAIKGSGYFAYVSRTSEFIGNCNVSIDVASVVCGSGSLGVLMRPGFWEVSIGRRESPIQINILCKDAIKFGSWLTVSPIGLDMGLFANIEASALSPDISLSSCSFKGYAVVGFELGVSTIMTYDPDFKINEAMIWASLYMDLGVDYNCPIGNGKLNLVSINAGGDLKYTAMPTSTVTGSLYAEVKILCIQVGFDMKIDKEMG